MNFDFKIKAYNIICIIVILLSFFFTCFSNPGIISKEIWNEKKITEKYKDLSRFNRCKICHIYTPKFMRSEHCDNCGLCIEKQIHHCFIFGKCVGKKNFFAYFSFVLFFIIYWCRTFVLILFAIYIKYFSIYKYFNLFAPW